jgi:Zn ribbon nucleic-acid-binding protein
MGSVLDFIECPNCKQEAYSDFYYKTGEEYINCQNCGYHYSAVIKNRTKNLTELTEADWEIKELKNPYCAYRIKYYEDLGTTCGALLSEEELSNLTTLMKQEGSKLEFFTISRLIDGEIKKTTIINNKPEQYWNC